MIRRSLAHHADNLGLGDPLRHRHASIVPVICRYRRIRNQETELGVHLTRWMEKRVDGDGGAHIRRRKSTTSTLRRIIRFPGDAGVTGQPAVEAEAEAEAPVKTPKRRRRFAASRPAPAPAPVRARSLFGGTMAPATNLSSLGLWYQVLSWTTPRRKKVVFSGRGGRGKKKRNRGPFG
jgi:hypothetical protein